MKRLLRLSRVALVRWVLAGGLVAAPGLAAAQCADALDADAATADTAGTASTARSETRA